MCSIGSVHAGLTHGLSRMTGNCHVRFLGEGAAAMPFPYPTRMDGKRKTRDYGRLKRGKSGASFPKSMEMSIPTFDKC
jgi:hypothetical protein